MNAQEKSTIPFHIGLNRGTWRARLLDSPRTSNIDSSQARTCQHFLRLLTVSSFVTAVPALPPQHNESTHPRFPRGSNIASSTVVTWTLSSVVDQSRKYCERNLEHLCQCSLSNRYSIESEVDSFLLQTESRFFTLAPSSMKRDTSP